ncbi:BON domain-containing protein [Cupriavidus consociatus]|uniref:BON domain-containing protein n=1 Tax=Cupriavidus consociatus TaxID=2821357 RepID=UPI001AEB205C|nr:MULTISPECIES: BON domain-containing protein [unclassified Cupriavidus]MBP0624663.1 BON domain-containing protein [Cupriavidus sp. LEh25]MDK2661375.1 BON domain-containing protein [Cupriavidus sp. LEh21]
MQTSEAVLTQARAALAHVPYQGHVLHPTIQLRLSDGALILEGEVADIVDKTRAATALRRVDGVTSVIDHLRVTDGGATVGDGELRDAVCERLLNAIEFRSCRICARVKGQHETVREPVGERSGWIEVEAHDGVVTLWGQVISLSHMRLAGVLAWWSRGCRCVVNELVVAPAEADRDDEITEALMLVLETDPFVDASQVTVHTENRVVTLEGCVASENTRRQVERDAWYVQGVEDVVNHISLRA